MDTHQLSNSNFNHLLKYNLYLFLLDTRTTGHTGKHNFKWTHASCPILTSMFLSYEFSIYFHWTHRQPDTQMNKTLKSHTSCPILTSIILSNTISTYFHWTHGQPDIQMNKTWTHTSCPIKIDKEFIREEY